MIRFTVAAAAIWLTATTSIMAQDTEAGSETDAPAEAEQTAESNTVPADQVPVSNGQNDGTQQENVVAVHDDWQVRCRQDETDCFMYQLAIDARELPIAEVTVVTLPEDDNIAAGFTVVSPLRSLLPQGITVQIDNGKQQRYQFRWCTEIGCFSRFGVNEGGLNQFIRGNKARITVVSIERPDSPYILDVSLKGFTSAYRDLQARDQ